MTQIYLEYIVLHNNSDSSNIGQEIIQNHHIGEIIFEESQIILHLKSGDRVLLQSNLKYSCKIFAQLNNIKITGDVNFSSNKNISHMLKEILPSLITNFKYKEQNIFDCFSFYVTKKYTHESRFHHNWQHILEVIEYLKLRSELTSHQLTILTFAAIMHDIIYIPSAESNENLSAKIAMKFAKLFEFNQRDILEITTIIKMTKNHLTALSNIEKIFANADLIIFAHDQNRYQEYIKSIRKEYSHINDQDYLAGRLRFLSKIQNHISNAKLYYDEQPILEFQASNNIKYEIDLLQKQIII